MFAFAWSEHNLARCGRLASSYGFYLTLLIFTCRKYYVQLYQMHVQFKDPFILLVSNANATSTHICASSLKVHSHDAKSFVTTSIFSWDKQWVLWQEMDVFTLTQFASVTLLWLDLNGEVIFYAVADAPCEWTLTHVIILAANIKESFALVIA